MAALGTGGDHGRGGLEFRFVVAVYLGAILSVSARGGRFPAGPTAIDGLLPVSLTNPNGPCDTSQNFTAFGLPPAQYATLDILLPEAFRRPIAALLLRIEWAGLPTEKQGFAGYYRDYRLDADGRHTARPLFDNRSFRATFAMHESVPWTLKRMPPQPMFRTVGGGAEPRRSAPVMPVSRFVLPVEPGWGDGANAGELVLRMTLAEPAYAFGNMLYSSNLMAAIRRTQLPNPPWLPMVKTITLGYYPR